MSEVSQGRPKPDEDLDQRKTHGSDPQNRDQPGEQERPLDGEETLEESLEDTFPASDPVPAKQIDGPNN